MKSKQTLSSVQMFLIWFGASVSLAEIMTGSLTAPLGFKKGIAAIIAGHLIGVTIMAAAGIIGAREKQAAIMGTGGSFGTGGIKLFSVLNIIQLTGWTVIMIISGSKAAGSVTGFHMMPLWKLIMGISILIPVMTGQGEIKKINSAAVVLLFILTLAAGKEILSMLFQGITIPPASGETGMTFGKAVELNVIMPLSWMPLVADYTRKASSGKKAAFMVWGGYFTGSCWMFIIGMTGTITTGLADPSGILSKTASPLAVVLIIIFSTATTAYLDVYSAGICTSNLTGRYSEKQLSVVIAILSILLSLFFPMERYENFLYIIGSLFAPLFTIVMTDYFILKKSTLSNSKWGLHAIIFWLIGIAVYYILLPFDIAVGVSLPVMGITSSIYILFRIMEKKYVNNI